MHASRRSTSLTQAGSVSYYGVTVDVLIKLAYRAISGAQLKWLSGICRAELQIWGCAGGEAARTPPNLGTRHGDSKRAA